MHTVNAVVVPRSGSSVSASAASSSASLSRSHSVVSVSIPAPRGPGAGAGGPPFVLGLPWHENASVSTIRLSTNTNMNNSATTNATNARHSREKKENEKEKSDKDKCKEKDKDKDRDKERDLSPKHEALGWLLNAAAPPALRCPPRSALSNSAAFLWSIYRTLRTEDEVSAAASTSAPIPTFRFPLRHPSMLSFSARLLSFHSSQFPHQSIGFSAVSPFSLALDGFFLLPPLSASSVSASSSSSSSSVPCCDRLTCFCCGLTLQQWNAADDGRFEHFRHSLRVVQEKKVQRRLERAARRRRRRGASAMSGPGLGVMELERGVGNVSVRCTELVRQCPLLGVQLGLLEAKQMVSAELAWIVNGVKPKRKYVLRRTTAKLTVPNSYVEKKQARQLEKERNEDRKDRMKDMTVTISSSRKRKAANGVGVVLSKRTRLAGDSDSSSSSEDNSSATETEDDNSDSAEDDDDFDGKHQADEQIEDYGESEMSASQILARDSVATSAAPAPIESLHYDSLSIVDTDLRPPSARSTSPFAMDREIGTSSSSAALTTSKSDHFLDDSLFAAFSAASDTDPSSPLSANATAAADLMTSSASATSLHAASPVFVDAGFGECFPISVESPSHLRQRDGATSALLESASASVMQANVADAATDGSRAREAESGAAAEALSMEEMFEVHPHEVVSSSATAAQSDYRSSTTNSMSTKELKEREEKKIDNRQARIADVKSEELTLGSDSDSEGNDAGNEPLDFDNSKPNTDGMNISRNARSSRNGGSTCHNDSTSASFSLLSKDNEKSTSRKQKNTLVSYAEEELSEDEITAENDWDEDEAAADSVSLPFLSSLLDESDVMSAHFAAPPSALRASKSAFARYSAAACDPPQSLSQFLSGWPSHVKFTLKKWLSAFEVDRPSNRDSVFDRNSGSSVPSLWDAVNSLDASERASLLALLHQHLRVQIPVSTLPADCVTLSALKAIFLSQMSLPSSNANGQTDPAIPFTHSSSDLAEKQLIADPAHAQRKSITTISSSASNSSSSWPVDDLKAVLAIDSLTPLPLLHQRMCNHALAIQHREDSNMQARLLYTPQSSKNGMLAQGASIMAAAVDGTRRHLAEVINQTNPF